MGQLCLPESRFGCGRPKSMRLHAAPDPQHRLDHCVTSRRNRYLTRLFFTRMTYRVPSWGKVLAKTCDWWSRKRMTEEREHTMMSFFRRAFTVSLQMKVVLRSGQRCGFMTLWFGSGSGSGSVDPCLWLMDPDPAIFVIIVQDANKKQIF